MKHRTVLAHCLLWAAAIVAAALLDAPSSLTLGLLPSLGALAWILLLQDSKRAGCGR